MVEIFSLGFMKIPFRTDLCRRRQILIFSTSQLDWFVHEGFALDISQGCEYALSIFCFSYLTNTFLDIYIQKILR